MRCVPAHDFTVAKAIAWRSSIHDDPPYQREGSIWSLDKQQLFIDSLLNGYDVPKIYLHDLRGQHPTLVYTVVDGRQRLTAIWRFLSGEFALAEDFRIEPANRPALPEGTPDPVAGQRFADFDRRWKEVLRRTYLAVVLIQNATEDDIEELFSRLNNGEPLNAAEKRNAMGGAIVELAREVAQHPFFTDRLGFPNGRHRHLELATRLLLVEHGGAPGGGVPDLRSRSLDRFVREARRLGARERRTLLAAVMGNLDRAARVFTSSDALLARPSAALVDYLFVRSLGPAALGDPGAVRAFLDRFETARRRALREENGGADPTLDEFTYLMQHGAHEPRSLERRLEILRGAFEV
jgi:hypothetical protein